MLRGGAARQCLQSMHTSCVFLVHYPCAAARISRLSVLRMSDMATLRWPRRICAGQTSHSSHATAEQTCCHPYRSLLSPGLGQRMGVGAVIEGAELWSSRDHGSTLYAAASAGASAGAVFGSTTQVPPLPSIAARADSVKACALTVRPLAEYSSGPPTTFLSVYLQARESGQLGGRRPVGERRERCFETSGHASRGSVQQPHERTIVSIAPHAEPHVQSVASGASRTGRHSPL